MPPKGWRKNAEGQYPQPNKEHDIVSIDDILFPRSTIQKLAKDVINDEGDDSGKNMILGKDSLMALQRSATVFVSHLLFQARQISKEQGRKTINAQDIVGALDKSEFSGFIPTVKGKLGVYESREAEKKMRRMEATAKSYDWSTEEPVKKRGKDNLEKSVGRDTSVNVEEEEINELEEASDGSEVEGEDEPDVQNQDEEEVSDGEEEKLENPLGYLGKEEQELAGPPVDDGSLEDGEEEIEDDEEDDS